MDDQLGIPRINKKNDQLDKSFGTTSNKAISSINHKFNLNMRN